MDIREYSLDDDIAAVATALAPAAISVIRTSGKNALKKCAKIFSQPKKLLSSKGNEVIYGWLLDKNKKIDEVILCTYLAPKSFTGENSVEIMCHGGVYITLEVLRLLFKAGFRQAKAGEFSFRSFFFGKNDLTKVEAIKEIVEAKTSLMTEQTVNRLDGVLYKKLQNAKNLLLSAIAKLYVHVEYPEDEEITESELDVEKVLNVKNILESVIQNWSTQKIFTDGAKVVLAGRPNSGKSKLFNTLLNEERSIVSDIAGTTRDWIETEINFNGLPIKLYDTAGLRFTNEYVEKIGIDKTKLLSENADLILYLVDGALNVTSEDKDFLQSKKFESIPKLLVFTKTDLLQTTNKLENIAKKILTEQIINNYVLVSSKTGIGLELLTKKAYNLLVKTDFKSENITVGTERQKTAVEKAIHFLNHALKSAELQMTSDAIILDLEEALHFLGEITGEVKSDDVLGAVFEGFCVGK